jgi:phospholipase A2
LKAEQWARDHGHAFPKIKGNPIIDDPDIRECYVFHEKDDDTCPIILHFPIVNKTFRKYVAPGMYKLQYAASVGSG